MNFNTTPTRYKELIEIDGEELTLDQGIELAVNIISLASDRIKELEGERLKIIRERKINSSNQ